jgi:tRNA pseudouridine55 synthase
MNGILIIDKPVGFTSHDVVAKLRKILKTKRIGHTGTLDPFATGVLVMLVGKATRLAQYLDKDVKEYIATLQFGFETDTGDLTGMPKDEGGRMKAEEITDILQKTNWEETFEGFRGEISQIPPMYSAKKIDGKKLYELAREGIEIEREAVNLTIHKLELVGNAELITDNLKIRVSCSAGTYIRTLAEDIGKKIGVDCHLSALQRTRAGKFSIEKAITLEHLESIVEFGELKSVLVSMNNAISHIPEIKLSAENVKKIENGSQLEIDINSIEGTVRLIDQMNNLIAIGNCEHNIVQPKIVLV